MSNTKSFIIIAIILGLSIALIDQFLYVLKASINSINLNHLTLEVPIITILVFFIYMILGLIILIPFKCFFKFNPISLSLSFATLSLMVFILLYVPCVATIAVIKKETDSWRWPLFTAGYTIIIAWLISFIVYQGGRFLQIGL